MHAALREELKRTFQEHRLGVKFHNTKGAIVIENPSNRNNRFDRDLPSPLGLTKERLKAPAIIIRLASFNSYIINFDLFDKDDNLFKGELSIVLRCFDVRASPCEALNYSPPHPVLWKITIRNQISDMRIFVTDETGELINFNRLLRPELEMQIKFA